MSIYDVRFYGYRTMNKIGDEIIVIYDNDFYTKKMPRKVTLDDRWTEKFSISVLEEYAGKKDVLKVEYATGREEYFTLHKPWYTKNENVWEEIQENQFAVKFSNLYAKVVLNNNSKDVNSSTNTIFARSFWVVSYYETYTFRAVLKVFANEIDARNYYWTCEQKSNIFEARVFPEYKGKEHVFKYKEQYFTLFDLLYSYDEGAEKWDVYTESDRLQIKEICDGIKEAYIKDISNNG